MLIEMCFTSEVITISGVFMGGGGCATATLWPDREFLGDLISRYRVLSEFLPSQFNDVIGPMEVRPRSQILDTLLIRLKLMESIATLGRTISINLDDTAEIHL
jgi:hypothetical protein